MLRSVALNILNPEFLHVVPLREAARLSRRIDHNRTCHSIHTKPATLTPDLVYPATLLNSSATRDNVIQRTPRNPESWPFERKHHFHRLDANTRRTHFNGACPADFVQQLEFAETLHSTRRNKSATHFRTRKAGTLQSDRIDSQPFQLP